MHIVQACEAIERFIAGDPYDNIGLVLAHLPPIYLSCLPFSLIKTDTTRVYMYVRVILYIVYYNVYCDYYLCEFIESIHNMLTKFQLVNDWSFCQ